MQKDQKSWKYYLLRIIPLYLLLISTGFFIAFLIFFFRQPGMSSSSQVIQIMPDNVQCQSLNVIRLKDYGLTQPLVLVENTVESEKLSNIKRDVIHFIDQKKLEGIITSASVYLREFNDGSWMAINKDELFSPGSLMKIPTLISLLKESEGNPGLLERKLYFKKHFSQIPEQTLTAKPLIEGKYYSVRELIYEMIANSDNDATALLNSTLNFTLMQKMFSDFQLPVPAKTQQDYKIDVSSCSRFLRILYNSSYLTKENSQFALELLTKSSFKEGIVKEIDPGLIVAHKFGERNVDGMQQLHEFGIFYLDGSPYLLGIMTKGPNNKFLPGMLSGISGLIYHAILQTYQKRMM